MKRALIVVLAFGLFGVLGWAQLSGSASIYGWTEDLSTLKLYTDLSLSYKVGDWTFSNYSILDDSGFSYTQFGIKGTLGPISLSGTMRFYPNATDIVKIVGRSDLKASLSFAGLDTGLWVFHDLVGAGNTFTLKAHRFGLRNVYDNDQWAISVTATQTAAMVWYTWVKVEGFRADVFFTDDSTGIEFNTLLAKTTIPLCCGINAETQFMFTKEEGFDWVNFILKDLSLCCGWGFDVSVQYGISGKTVEIAPKFKGLEGCLTIYGGWPWYEGEFTGIDIHGIGLKCALGDCSEIGFLTAFAPQYFWVDAYALLGGNFPGMASGYFYRYYDSKWPNPLVQPLPRWWYSYYTELFGEGEYEVIWLKGCGAGCCGGQYTYEIDVFFSGTGFFGISRARALTSIPVTSNISFDLLTDIGVTGLNLVGGGISLSF
jgi:hypothetical protein